MLRNFHVDFHSGEHPSRHAVVHTTSGLRTLTSIAPKPNTQSEFLSMSLSHSLLTESGDILYGVLSAIRKTAGFSHILVGELCGTDWNQIETLVVDTLQGPADNFRYELRGTPCQEVLDSSCIAFTTNVWRLFPEDHLLEQMGIQSYIGIPVHDDVGRPLGIIVLLNQEDISLEQTQKSLELLALSSSLVKRTLMERRKQRDVAAILESASSSNSSTCVNALLQSITKSLMVNGAFLSTPPERGGSPRTILSIHGRTLPDCGLLFSPAFIQQAHAANTAFLTKLVQGEDYVLPDDTDERMRTDFSTLMRHVLLIPLRNEEGEFLGLAGAFHESALNPRILQLPLLQLLSDKLTMLLREEKLEQTRRAAEHRVQQLQQLESLGMLAAGIAHDFNNILVGVLGNADYLLELLPPSVDRDIRESVEDIRKAATSANGLCKQLTRYARRTKIELKPFDLVPLLEELSKLAVTTLDVPCTLHMDHNLVPVGISGDETQIRQVLMNLLVNARDALGPGGRVALTLSTQTVDKMGSPCFSGLVPAGEYAVISVRDNGCGMEDATLTRIFEPFYTTKGTGHGLGLAGTLGLIESHQGWLDVSSVPGVGTEFKVYLPLSEALPSAAPLRPTIPISSVQRRKTLLIVDDDARIRRLLTRFSSKAGYDTIFAEDGVGAVEVYRKHQAEVVGVLLDLNMPVCNGEQCYAQLKEINPSIKVLVSSGSRVNNLGLPQLPKPYSFHTFVSSINALLNPSAQSLEEECSQYPAPSTLPKRVLYVS